MIPATIFPTPATGRRRGDHARPRAVHATTRLDRGRGHGPVRRHAHPASRHVRLPLRVLLIGAIASALVFTTAPLSAPEARAAVPSVVIIVGPAGRATDRYRADGNEAARVARAAGAAVTTIYSPDATWPRVKAALQGASIVVYMGHGNGFPSRYGPVLNKKTKDGLGLNPVAGVDDVAHQYFGEAYLTRHIRLAPHAVVLLHHLCYASGNSEPGLVEGTLETAKSRVDNMAAGWLDAGAEAVLAEAYGHPAYYVKRILAGRATIESIWRKGPTAHNHVLAFPSVRTPGMTGLMDPTKRASGFYRSLVVRAKLRADEVAAGAAIARRTTTASTPSRSSPPTGPTVSAVKLRGVPIIGARLDLVLDVEAPGSRSLEAFGVGVRWDPLALDSPEPSRKATAAPIAGTGTVSSSETIPGRRSRPGRRNRSAAPEPSAAPKRSAAPEPPGSPERSAALEPSSAPELSAAPEPKAARSLRRNDPLRRNGPLRQSRPGRRSRK